MDRKNLIILVLAALVLFLILSPRTSGYGHTTSVQGSNMGMGPADAAVNQGGADLSMSAMSPDYNAADGVSSASLIPREVVQTEDFGQFSPDKILTNQNYLDPRSQIGYPETIGGVLRNANRDFRSEPINPRTPVSIFNLSTIPPDTMRPKFEIGSEF
jgi:hypothetical protein